MQNIAMKHGKNEKFSCAGIIIAINFWVLNGHKVIGFMPEYLMDSKKVAEK